MRLPTLIQVAVARLILAYISSVVWIPRNAGEQNVSGTQDTNDTHPAALLYTPAAPVALARHLMPFEQKQRKNASKTAVESVDFTPYRGRQRQADIEARKQLSAKRIRLARLRAEINAKKRQQLTLLFCTRRSDRYCNRIGEWLANLTRKVRVASRVDQFQHLTVYAPELRPKECGSMPRCLIYYVADRGLQMPDPLVHVKAVQAWLNEINMKTRVSIVSGETFNPRVIDSGDRSEGTAWWLILLYDSSEAACQRHVYAWRNFARSFYGVSRMNVSQLLPSANISYQTSTNYRIRVAKMDVNSKWSYVFMKYRLGIEPPDGYYGSCALGMLYNQWQFRLFRFSPFMDYRLLRQFLFRIILNDNAAQGLKARITAGASWWSPMPDDLSDIEYDYFDLEHLASILQRKSSHVLIGITGGAGVIVLAVTIFFGLKTAAAHQRASDRRKKRQKLELFGRPSITD